MAFLMKRMAVTFSLTALAAGLASAAVTAGDNLDQRIAVRGDSNTNSTQLKDLRLATPLSAKSDSTDILNPASQTANNGVAVIVRLKDDPVSIRKSARSTPEAAKQAIERDQQQFIERTQAIAPDANVVGSTQVVINSVMLEGVDSSEIDALASDPAVLSVTRVIEYEKHLSETAPYIGAWTMRNFGYTGRGVSVGVIDSGIDYTHVAMGGSGDISEFTNNNPGVIEAGTFPTARVVGGYDFVGSNWGSSSDPVEPDPDPLDDGPGGGHGTHVADIIGGATGVAPGVDLYALKACSSVSTSCSGIALLQAVEWAADPNGDGDTSDHLDIVNMSLGSNYGQPFDDDLVFAVNNASAAGVLFVASAGNGSNKPYITGSPSSAASALSVAQTQVPSAEQPLLEFGGFEYPSVFQPWSQTPAGVVAAPIQYGDGAGGNLDGCTAFTAGSLNGLAVLVDRGACNFTLKIRNIEDAGGVIGVIGLVAPGDPFSGGSGSHGPFVIPAYMISQSTSVAMKAAAGTDLTIDPSNGLSLVGQMVGSSSRGPQHDATHLLKPEIGAPGASISALTGTGDGTSPFGGTSGAAPMVSGAAALLLQFKPDMAPAEAKAQLINTADPDIATDPYTGLAPITRIGGGEVRAYAAVSSPAVIMEQGTGQGALSFGFHDIATPSLTLSKDVVITSKARATQTFDISSSFRYTDDESSGAIDLEISPASVNLQAGQSATVRITMTINGEKLPDNIMSSGPNGANPGSLTAMEFDGYIEFNNGSKTLRMPWHVLPRKSASISGRTALASGGDSITLTNDGMGSAQIETYALIALSDNIPEGGQGEQSPTPDIRAIGVNTRLVEPGTCSDDNSFIWEFAISTWERQQHLLPVSHLIYLDTNQDGIDDYAVLNRDASGISSITDGRQLVWSMNLSTGDLNAYYFAEHSTNTANTVLRVCAEQLGMSIADVELATNVDITVRTQDFYYGGPGDAVSNLTITPYGERFTTDISDIAAGDSGVMEVTDWSLWPGNSPEYGLLMFSNSSRGTDLSGSATEATEALIFEVQ